MFAQIDFITLVYFASIGMPTSEKRPLGHDCDLRHISRLMSTFNRYDSFIRSNSDDYDIMWNFSQFLMSTTSEAYDF